MPGRMWLRVETDRLNGLVSEAIQMARIEAGRLQLKKQPLAVGDLVQSAVDAFRTGDDSRPIHIEASAALPKVDADAEMVALVLRQLVGNAISGNRFRIRTCPTGARAPRSPGPPQ